MPTVETLLFKDDTGNFVEITLTGRSATNTIPAVGTASERKITLVEITPSDMEDGRWKKFVMKNLLIPIDQQ